MVYFKLPTLRVHLFGYVFSPKFVPTIVTLLLLAVLTHLGCWQLDRAAQKRLLETALSHQRSEPLTISQLPPILNSGYRYQSLQVVGHFDNAHTLFIDNKIYRHQVGYHLLTPLQLTNGSWLLVNRGFIAAADRQRLPKVTNLSDKLTVNGLIDFPQNTLVLKKEPLAEQWPLRVQALELKQLEKLLHHPLYPFILLQQGNDNTGLKRDWQLVVFPSYRHTGYAVQWFALALTLLILYIRFTISRSK